MNVATRLAAFAVLLAVAFGVAALAGAAIDPPKRGDHGQAGVMPATSDAHPRGAMAATVPAGMAASGLAVSSDGLTLAPDRMLFAAGQPARLQFRIIDALGAALREQFQVESARRLHCIVVSRDLAIYQHLHPTQAPDGTWSVDLTLPQAGVYRAYADFQVAGAKQVLATDLFAPGKFAPRAFPAAADTAQATLDTTRQLSGKQVMLNASGLRAGRETMLTFAVTRNGRPVGDLQPYLGAKGHLAALRVGDLAYLHVHPDQARLAGNEIQFMSSFPTAGTYRLFLQFQRGAKVRTVAYTLEVPR